MPTVLERWAKEWTADGPNVTTIRTKRIELLVGKRRAELERRFSHDEIVVRSQKIEML